MVRVSVAYCAFATVAIPSVSRATRQAVPIQRRIVPPSPRAVTVLRYAMAGQSLPRRRHSPQQPGRRTAGGPWTVRAHAGEPARPGPTGGGRPAPPRVDAGRSLLPTVRLHRAAYRRSPVVAGQRLAQAVTHTTAQVAGFTHAD